MSHVDKELLSLSGSLLPILSNADNNVFFQGSKDINLQINLRKKLLENYIWYGSKETQVIS